MTHRPLLISLALAALAAVPVAAQISVGPNVQVSTKRQKDAHYELLAGAHPTDRQRLITCSIVSSEKRGRDSTVVYLSTDGGATWTPTLQPDDIESSGDPVCAFGPDGTAYYVALTSYAGRRGDMLVYRSADSGKTWSKPIALPIIDRENIAFDGTGGKFAGRVYINGTGVVRGIDGDQTLMTDLTLFRSTDGGAAFTGPVKRSAIGKPYVVGMGNGVVLSDGTFAALFGELKEYWQADGKGEIKENKPGSPNAWLRVIRSDDGGESLMPGVTVSDWYMERDRSQGSHIPMLAVDAGSKAFKDRLYAVWVDGRSGRLEILLSHSRDKGKTWSKPIVVNDDRAALDPANGPDAITPLVAVNKDGIVGVSWADRREHPDNLGYDKRFAASLDGGETFLPSVRVSSAPTVFGKNEAWPVRSFVSGGGTPVVGGASQERRPSVPLSLGISVNAFLFSEGHTGGMAVDAAGVFHPVWVDNRTGIAQLWTAPVTVKGDVINNGAADLAALDDVSEKVTLEVSGASYDRATGEMHVIARLKNTSKETIRGPVKARVIALRSDVGVPQVIGADNGQAGPGAVWDFTPLIKEEGLKPDDLSQPKTLAFHLSDLRPFRQGKGVKFGLINLDARVLAPAVKTPASVP